MVGTCVVIGEVVSAEAIAVAANIAVARTDEAACIEAGLHAWLGSAVHGIMAAKDGRAG
jgi:hypothetical protein